MASTYPALESTKSTDFRLAEKGGHYFYNASVPAAIVFAVLYGLVLIAHSWLAVRYKTAFMGILLIGGVLEFVGYATR